MAAPSSEKTVESLAAKLTETKRNDESTVNQTLHTTNVDVKGLSTAPTLRLHRSYKPASLEIQTYLEQRFCTYVQNLCSKRTESLLRVSNTLE